MRRLHRAGEKDLVTSSVHSAKRSIARVVIAGSGIGLFGATMSDGGIVEASGDHPCVQGEADLTRQVLLPDDDPTDGIFPYVMYCADDEPTPPVTTQPKPAPVSSSNPAPNPGSVNPQTTTPKSTIASDNRVDIDGDGFKSGQHLGDIGDANDASAGLGQAGIDTAVQLGINIEDGLNKWVASTVNPEQWPLEWKELLVQSTSTTSTTATPTTTQSSTTTSTQVASTIETETANPTQTSMAAIEVSDNTTTQTTIEEVLLPADDDKNSPDKKDSNLLMEMTVFGAISSLIIGGIAGIVRNRKNKPQKPNTPNSPFPAPSVGQ